MFKRKKKYILTDETITIKDGDTERILHRIKAVRKFGHVRNRELGGFVESEKNLSHEGDCWIYGEAKAYANAIVYENGKLTHYVEARDHAKIHGNSVLQQYVVVSDYAEVCDYAYARDNAKIGGHAIISGHGIICGKYETSEYEIISGDTARGGPIPSGNSSIYYPDD